MNRNFSAIRSVPAAQAAVYRSERVLRAAGRAVVLRSISPPRGYATLSAIWNGQEYDGWIDLCDVMRLRYRSLDSLAWRSFDKRYALNLFEGQSTLAELPGPQGGWSSVRLTGLVEHEVPVEPLLHFDEPGHARAYFRRFPDEPRVPDLTTRIGWLPCLLRFAVGETNVPLKYMASIEPGDVLLVRSVYNAVKIGAMPFCGFEIEDNEIVITEKNSSEVEFDTDVPQGSAQSLHFPEAGLFDLDALPVTLEFLLQEEHLTVAQLADCRAGTILPLRGSSEKIVIRANGQIFGCGELVQIGDQLAVEVKTIRQGKSVERHGE
ncbi:type III secretion system cytoplasmic ring protein SctQ [Burkholderia ubonensis]|uniref:type III secretion system cytoplasmic ring protein SctQ n=1 Tax=Burkholderia ubonensis TaxID=101571 RepID=UPI00075384CC|nr:type III secretion system cytoplasmic ring protein SctQ [Burkholderia ubonensis]KWK77687.1 hypothetical protein WM15_26770 [Burkholderia ubonensis]